MNRLNATWLTALLWALTLGSAAEANAGRSATSSSAPRQRQSRVARTTRARPPAQRTTVNSAVLAQKFYKGDKAQPMPTWGKNARSADWVEGRGYTTEGTQSAFKELYKGATERYEAAAMYIIPKQGIQQTVVKDVGNYGSNQSLEVRVTGLGNKGTYEFDFLGSVSTHNEGGSYSGAALKQFIAKRVASDGVKLTHIKPNGTRVDIVSNHPSDVVTHLSKSINLEPGRNVIRYERTDRASGRIVSAQGLYSEWRSVVIHWDGK